MIHDYDYVSPFAAYVEINLFRSRREEDTVDYNLKNGKNNIRRN